MRSERFSTEYFSRVMSAEEEIHAEVFGGNRRPMRRFTGDECVDPFVCDPVNFRPGGSGHNAYRARLFRTEIEDFYLTIQRLFQFTNEFTALERCANFQTNRLALLFQERLRGF